MNRKIRVLNTFPFSSGDLEAIQEVSTQIVLENRPGNTQEAANGIVDGDVEVLLCDYPPSSQKHTPRLMWLQTAGAGVEYLRSAAPWDWLKVCNASGTHAVSIGEFVLGSILRVTQLVDDRIANQRHREWPSSQESLAGLRLRGATMVVVGYGSIGRQIAKLAQAFGVEVIAVKARPYMRHDDGYTPPGTGDPDATIPSRIVGPEQLVDVAPLADYLVISAPRTSRTERMIGDAVLKALRKHCWIVNVGRGSLIDDEALIVRLRENRIGGAILDVFSEEPLPASSPYWTLPNVIVTPHVSGARRDPWPEVADLARENLARYVDGRPLLNVIDPELGY